MRIPILLPSRGSLVQRPLPSHRFALTSQQLPGRPPIHHNQNHNQVRHYDKNAYKRFRKSLRSASNSSTTFPDALSLQRTYTLGIPSTLSLSIRLNIPKDVDLDVGGEIVMPNPVKIGAKEGDYVVFVGEGDKCQVATKLGAAVVGGMELLDKMANGTMDLKQITSILCTPSIFPSVIKIARILGPLGLMPSPKRGTVNTDVEAMFALLSRTQRWNISSSEGQKEVKVSVGKTNWEDTKIQTNVVQVISNVEEVMMKHKKRIPGKVIKSLAIVSSSGPYIEIKPLADDAGLKQDDKKVTLTV